MESVEVEESTPLLSVENESPEQPVIEAEKPEVTDDDGEEIDYEGEKYKVPAKLKEAFLRQADYTRKTQEVAEQKRDIERQAAEVQQRAQFNQQHVQDVAKVMAIDEQLAKYQGLDWNAITDADPVQAMKLDRQMRELQQQRTASVERILPDASVTLTPNDLNAYACSVVGSVAAVIFCASFFIPVPRLSKLTSEYFAA